MELLSDGRHYESGEKVELQGASTADGKKSVGGGVGRGKGNIHL